MKGADSRAEIRAPRSRMPGMRVRFACSCGSFLEVPDSLAGRHVRCPRCRAVVRAEDQAPFATLVDEPPPSPAPPATPVSRGRCAIGLAIAGYAWALGFLLVATQISDAFGLAALGATYLVAPGALYRYSTRRGSLLGDVALLGVTTLLLAAATAMFVPAAVRLSSERLNAKARTAEAGR